MNIKLSFLLILLFTAPLAVAQNNCNLFYPLKQGTTFQITTYNQSDQPISVLDYEILKVENTSAGKVATVSGSANVNDDQMISELKYQVTCKDNKLSIDYESLLSPKMKEQFEQMDYEISGTNLDWPNDLSVGQTLPDSNMTMRISMSGMEMKMEMDITDRKVIGKEKITTPAGTYDCYVITYNTGVQMMGTVQNTNTKQWISEGVGMVKQENSIKGKVESTSMLTAFSD